MLRLLASLIAAAFALPLFAEIVFLIRNDSPLSSLSFDYKPQIGLLALLFIVILGLPWVPLLKKREITGPLSVVLLAGLMGALPFAIYALIVIAEAWQSTGQFPSRMIATDWPQFTTLMSSTFAYGTFCGAVIWITGVWRNRWFKDRVDA